MIVKPAQAESFVEKPRDGIAAALLYGPNRGLVEDRGARLGASIAPPGDPFRVADLAPAAVAADPALLVDEAAALSMTGGRRLVRVRDAGNDVADACAALLARHAGDSFTIVEAGDLKKRAKLRSLFEGAANAAAIPCYDDDPAALRGLCRRYLDERGARATPAALDALAGRLSGDRRVILGELDKLVLYAGPEGGIDDTDVLTCVGDSAEATLDDLADAAGAGDLESTGRALDRLAADGATPVRVLTGLQRHFQALHRAAGSVARGATPAEAVAALRPPVFFKRRRAVAMQVARWSAADIARAMELLLDAEIACKTTGCPASVLCARTAMRVAAAARRRGR